MKNLVMPIMKLLEEVVTFYTSMYNAIYIYIWCPRDHLRIKKHCHFRIGVGANLNRTFVGVERGNLRK